MEASCDPIASSVHFTFLFPHSYGEDWRQPTKCTQTSQGNGPSHQSLLSTPREGKETVLEELRGSREACLEEVAVCGPGQGSGSWV